MSGPVYTFEELGWSEFQIVALPLIYDTVEKKSEMTDDEQ